MACPRCGSEKIVEKGFYVTKMYKKRYRFTCSECNRTFVIGNFKNIPQKTEKEIIRLSRRKNPHASRFDPRKDWGLRKVRTYSIREIERIMNVSHTTIEKVLKKNRENWSKNK